MSENRVKDRVADEFDGTTPAGMPLVPYGGTPQQVQPYNPVGAIGQFYCNWHIESMADKALALRYQGEADRKGADVVGQTIAIERFLCHPAESVNDKTGEVEYFTRTILIDPDGGTVAFGSNGILKWLGRFVTMFGRGPWHPPLVVRVKQVQTGRKNRTYELELATELMGERLIDVKPTKKTGK